MIFMNVKIAYLANVYTEKPGDCGLVGFASVVI